MNFFFSNSIFAAPAGGSYWNHRASSSILLCLALSAFLGPLNHVNAQLDPVIPIPHDDPCSNFLNYVEAGSEALCVAAANWAVGSGYYTGLTFSSEDDSNGRPLECYYDPVNTVFVWNTNSVGDPSDNRQKICIDPAVIVATNSGGDPHFIGFNQKVVTYQGECTLVLLDSPAATATGDDVTIHVRTTRKLDFSYISGVAMKIGDDVIEVTPKADILLNGKVITGEEVTMSGLPFVLTKEEKGTKKMIVSYSFDIGHGRVIDVQANKKRGMMFVRTKGMFPAETVGILGSPNKMEMVSRDGKVLMTDVDVNAYGESWQVKDTDVQLFKETLGPQYPEKCLYEDAPGATAQLRGRRKLLAKKVVTVEEARAACASVRSDLKRELCVQDSIAMGDVDLKDDPFYME